MSNEIRVFQGTAQEKSIRSMMFQKPRKMSISVNGFAFKFLKCIFLLNLTVS